MRRAEGGYELEMYSVGGDKIRVYVISRIRRGSAGIAGVCK